MGFLHGFNEAPAKSGGEFWLRAAMRVCTLDQIASMRPPRKAGGNPATHVTLEEGVGCASMRPLRKAGGNTCGVTRWRRL